MSVLQNEDDQDKKAAASQKKAYLKYALTAAILIGLVFAIRKYINLEEVLDALREFNYPLIPLMLALSGISLLLKGWRFVPLMRPITDVPGWTLVKAYISGQSATLLPGGVAARAGLLNQVGVPVSKASVPVAIVSLMDTTVFLLGIALAALWFQDARPYAIGLGIALIALGAVLMIRPIRGQIFRVFRWLAGKLRFGEQWESIQGAVEKVGQPAVLLPSLLISIIAFVPWIIILNLALQGIGETAGYSVLLLAFVLPTLAGRWSALPAGVGVTEAGMVGVLSAYGSINPNAATASVAIYRIATVIFPALLGVAVYLLVWRGEKELAEKT